MSGSPLEELTAALRRLHRNAGEPSTHQIGKKINYSHTTVAQALKGTRCPSWRVIEAIVSYLDGDLEVFRSHWVAVRDAQAPLPSKSKPALIERDPSHSQDVEAVASPNSENHTSVSNERVVLRWTTKLETVEFLDEGLALQWIKARMQVGEEDE